MRRLLLFLFLSFYSIQSGFAQGKFAIQGIVKDVEGKVLPGASIYLSRYQIGTSADGQGKFNLANLSAGNYDLLIEVLGYMPQTQNVVIADQSVVVEITMPGKAIQLEEVVIRGNVNRKLYLDLFKKYFIGESPNAQKCKLLNPEVIQIDYDHDRRVLSIKATQLLLIDNEALGYRVKYLLNYFVLDEKSGVVLYSGHPHFEETKTSAFNRRKFEQARKVAYLGSVQHFYKSLYQHATKKEGFLIYQLNQISNVKKPEKTLIDSNIQRFSTLVSMNDSRSGKLNDSLEYWTDMKKEPDYFLALHDQEVQTDTLVKTKSADFKEMDFKNPLYIIYTQEKESRVYTKTLGYKINRPKEFSNYQVSMLTAVKNPVKFNPDGAVDDPQSVIYEGFWAYEKIGDLLPLDYVETQ